MLGSNRQRRNGITKVLLQFLHSIRPTALDTGMFLDVNSSSE
jgi:hypothetical protein